MHEIFTIIVAAGMGLRMGSKTKKQFLQLEGIPVLTRTIMAFEACDQINEIILVIAGEDMEFCKKQIIAPFGFKKKVHLVEGGKERQDSVSNGLRRVLHRKNPKKETLVLIHDGVRPFIHQRIIDDCIKTASENGACIPAVKITDTVKKVSPDSRIEKTLNRELLYKAQTPQAFNLSLILRAFDYAAETSFLASDDAALVEHLGQKVMIIKGSDLNIKITTPEDLVLGKFILEKITDGNGY